MQSISIKRRATSEVLTDIMELATNPIRPTRLMNLSNSCYVQFVKYVKHLKALGFIKEVDISGRTRNKALQITEKGSEFLIKYGKLVEVISFEPREKTYID